MIDLHCHILPGLDDGAASLAVSLMMAAMAADSGVEYIFATPHCNTRNPQQNFRSPELINAFLALQEAIDQEQIPIRILSGAEVLARGHFEEHLERGDFMTLNASRYLLVEFYFDESPDYMDRSLRAVEEAGLVPVVAHPERYFKVQSSPQLADLWRDRGYVLQINKDSLLGSLGAGAYETSALLLRRGLASVIASDGHNARFRTPHMGALLQELEARFPEIDPEPLLWTNPLKIAKDQSL